MTSLTEPLPPKAADDRVHLDSLLSGASKDDEDVLEPPNLDTILSGTTYCNTLYDSIMVLGLGSVVSDMMTKGYQSPVFGSPVDYDLPYEHVKFKTKDGVTLRGWLVGDASTTQKVIIQSHYGVQCSRSGYTPDGKGLFPAHPTPIEFLRAIPTYIQQGYSVLMYDLRNHGLSDPGPSEYVSWGPNEANDVIAAVDFCANKMNFEQIYLLGICMGGASTTYAFGMEDGLQKYSDKLKALVFVQPITYQQLITNMGVPRWIDSMATPVNKERIGFDLNEKSFFKVADKVNIPTMVIQNNNDNFHKSEEVLEYFVKLGTEEKEMVWLDLDKGRPHTYVWLATPVGAEKVVSWFNQYD